MFSLKNRRVLLTGATGGIGQAVTKSLIERGALVVGSGTASNHTLLLEMEKTYNGQFKGIQCDLSVPFSEIDFFLKEAEKKAEGTFDTLIYNAGVTADKLALRMTEKNWMDVITVNLTAAFLCCKAVLPEMMKSRFGRIIVTSSIVGFTGNVGQANYTASKAGMIGLMKTFALEAAGRNVTVNAVAPGFINTKMTEKIPEEVKQEFLKRIPLGKFGEPEDVASAIVFLASSEAHYITGSTLHVNGGLYM
ncbi:3-oxoacyl-[acyl-carrier-protein] reductase FabG [Candidatus Fokinia solitaria]|uniref:3-oxoacyl-[acyl-carrier-protein] reductase FabG n=1 Tax=Candidatus Fokinia solitaria TaxID=1802984 RepID=A0A2U8BR78_9RICK|nr:3-oxoacyl-ACP reductase FabG [Candidatus Fokinia solitaria]AWD32841.1 3-oxoacyl-[acyl-carrier-protein] reductase FabG [Candidatus Fokinia solitaria]